MAYHWCKYDGLYSQESHKGQEFTFEAGIQVSEGTHTLHGGHGHPWSWPSRRRWTKKTGRTTHYSPTHWLQCFYTIMLVRHDATVAKVWPTVHEKTSHGPPTEGRPTG